MKIPKRIDALLKKRTQAWNAYSEAEDELSDWFWENGISASIYAWDVWRDDSEKLLRIAIEEK